MKLEISNVGGVELAYLQLGRGRVSHTFEISSSVLLDLDQFDCVVGVEILDLSKIPSTKEITSAAHVKDAYKSALELGLNRLQRVKTTSGSLTNRSQLHATPIDFRKLEFS